MSEATNLMSPLHPHEPEKAPVYDPEGRCLVCGCEWRDQEIARRDGEIQMLLGALREANPESPLLPENVEENEGWEKEAHGYPPDEDFITSIGTGMRRTGEALPGVDMSRPDDHGIVRRLP